MPKRIFLFLCFVFSLAIRLSAQTHLSVPLDHPVYTLISQLEARTVLTRLSQIKPYTRYQIRLLLEEVKAKSYLLTSRELEIVQRMAQEFEGNFDSTDKSLKSLLEKGRADFAGFNSTASIGLRADTFFRIDVNSPENYYTSTPVRVYVRGDFFGPYVSYDANVIFSFDRLRQEPFIHPGLYRPSGMGFHQSLSNDFITNIFTYNNIAFGYDMRPELTASFFDGRLVFRAGILEGLNAGHGSSGLILSNQATAFPSFEMNMRPLEWMNFYSIVGSLGNFMTDSQNSQDIQNQKMFSYHNLEFFMNDYIYLSFYEGIIWGKRFEIAYLNPFNAFMIAQNLTGDVDNVALGFSGAISVPYVGKLWFDLFFDELVLNDFKSPRTELAVQVGITIPIPGLPFSSITGQYTKIEPYTYTHYPQSYSTNGLSVQGKQVYTNTNFTNQGRNLGYYLKPNSDEIHVSFETLPMPGLEVSVSYSLIRHGTNLKVKRWRGNDGKIYDTQAEAVTASGGATAVNVFNDYMITGDIDAYLNYGIIGAIERKSFLNDGIYDWTNAVRLWLSYDFAYLKSWLPFKVGVGYEFAHTFFQFNGRETVQNPDGSTNTVAMFQDQFTGGFKNIFGIYVQIYQ